MRSRLTRSGGGGWRTSSLPRKAGAILTGGAIQKNIFTEAPAKIVPLGFCLLVAPMGEQLEALLGTKLCKAAAGGAAGLHMLKKKSKQ